MLLTGGTGGIGLAIAKRLIEEGAGRVVIISRSQERAIEAIKKIKLQTSLPDPPLSYIEADITNTDATTSPIHLLFQSFPYCNTLINSAGIPEHRPIIKTTSTQQRNILDTNLHAPMDLSRHFLKHYISSLKHRTSTQQQSPATAENTAQSYCTINISSLLAYKAVIGTAAYSAAKAGLIAHTRVLALEGARYAAGGLNAVGGRPPFRANVVVPGYIDTAMLSTFTPEMRQSLENQVPLRRYGSPEEVADAVVFLLANEYANNCVLNLDGGLSAC